MSHKWQCWCKYEHWMVLFIELLAGCAARFKGRRKNGALTWMKRFRRFLMASASYMLRHTEGRQKSQRPGLDQCPQFLWWKMRRVPLTEAGGLPWWCQLVGEPGLENTSQNLALGWDEGSPTVLWAWALLCVHYLPAHHTPTTITALTVPVPGPSEPVLGLVQ